MRELYGRVRKLFRPVRWWCAETWGMKPVPTSRCLFLRLGLPFDATPNQIEDAFARLQAKQLPPQAKLLLDEADAVLGHWAHRELYILTQRALQCHGLASAVGVRRRRFFPLVPHLVSRLFDFCPRP